MSIAFKLQSLKGKKISFSTEELEVIDALQPLMGNEWSESLKGGAEERFKVRYGKNHLRSKRDKLVKSIKGKLIKIQGKYCIYCGLKEEHCNGDLQREHILGKETERYPHLMFEPENLALACEHCNERLKRREDVCMKEDIVYAKSKFKIVHPYFDDIHKSIVQVSSDSEGILLEVLNNCPKGKETLRLFKLTEKFQIELRAKALINEAVKVDDELLKRVMKEVHRKYVSK